MSEVVIVSRARTAVGSFGGSLKDVPVIELGALVIKEAIKRAGFKPKSSAELLEFGPKPLKSPEMTELEKSKYDWDKSLRRFRLMK